MGGGRRQRGALLGARLSTASYLNFPKIFQTQGQALGHQGFVFGFSVSHFIPESHEYGEL